MIKSFAHKGIKAFFETGTKAGIQAVHASRLRLQLAALNRAKVPTDMAVPNWKLHPLKGNLAGHWAVTVNGNWRITFRFENGDALLVDYQDYH
ncbi:MAG: type II toxin-antitoxin system RelE/ParE family toxin [Gallionella sp.]|jgi:proteic killer suppression protein